MAGQQGSDGGSESNGRAGWEHVDVRPCLVCNDRGNRVPEQSENMKDYSHRPVTKAVPHQSCADQHAEYSDGMSDA
jgi:hypothetical protein